MPSLPWCRRSSVGELGAEAVAAVGVGQRVFFALQAVLMAISAGTTALVARAWGADDRDEASRVTMASLAVGGAFAIALTFPGFLAARPVASIFGLDAETIELAASNVRWMSVFNVAFAINMVLGSALRAAGDAWSPLWVGAGVNVINIPLLYLLVFGHYGFPAMGVAGAAIAGGVSLHFGRPRHALHVDEAGVSPALCEQRLVSPRALLPAVADRLSGGARNAGVSGRLFHLPHAHRQLLRHRGVRGDERRRQPDDGVLRGRIRLLHRRFHPGGAASWRGRPRGRGEERLALALVCGAVDGLPRRNRGLARADAGGVLPRRRAGDGRPHRSHGLDHGRHHAAVRGGVSPSAVPCGALATPASRWWRR